MQPALINHIKKFVALNEADAELISSAVAVKPVKKKAFYCNRIIFAVKFIL